MDALLIEDSCSDARIVKLLIKASDSGKSRVHHVERFEEALKLLAVNTFDIILLDLNLPDGKGLQLLKRLRQLIPKTPIVILTGLQDSAIADEALQEGAQDYVVKSETFSPIRLSQLGYGDVGNLLLQRLRYAIKRTEVLQSLDHNQERYALVAQATNDGIWEWDVDTNRIYCSKKWISLLGLSDKTVNDGSDVWLSRIHPQDRAMFKQKLQTLLTKQKQLHCEYRIQHENGDYLWILTKGSAILDENGNILRLIGTHTNITVYSELSASPPKKTELPQRVLHSTSIGIISNLAALYIEEDRLDEALPLVEGTLLMRKWLLGDAHIEVASNTYQLATLNDNLGRYKKAENFYKEALGLFEKLLGPQDTTTKLIRLKTFMITRMNQKMGV